MTFQALRIVVNREYDELRGGMAAGLELLRVGGRIAVLTWKHSECAIVVDFLRRNELARSESPLKQWYQRAIGERGDGKKVKPARVRTGVVAEDALRPTQAEVRMNSRVRSAVLHSLRCEAGFLMRDLEKRADSVLKWGKQPEEVTPFRPSVAENP